jgi:hypothetical protein
MSTETSTAGTPGIVERVNILTSPRTEWQRIAIESTGLGALLTGYVLPLAAIGAIANIIGSMLFLGFLFGTAGLIPAIIGAVISIAFTLLGVFLGGILINALASSFGSQPNQTRANQLAAYSSTASLVGSWGAIIPFLGWLFAIAGGIYSIVLFYMGLTPMMATPEDKRVLYTIVLALIAIVCWWIIGMITAMLLVSFGLGAAGALGGAMSRGISFNQSAPQAEQQAEITLPGGVTINQNGDSLSLGNGGAAAASVSPAAMQGMLPQSLPGGFNLVSSSSSAIQGLGTTQAEGVYQNGDASISLTLMHMGAMGGITAMAGAMGVQESHQDADGYYTTNTVDGRIVNEQVSRSANTAKYEIVGRGVAITADGRGVGIDQVRAAVNAVGIQRLESMPAS